MAKDHHTPQPVLSLRDTAIALWNAKRMAREVAEALERPLCPHHTEEKVLDLPTPMYLRVVPPTDEDPGAA